MKVVKVKYSKLVSDDNYGNESHGAEAVVEDGEAPENARAELILWVDDILEKRGMRTQQRRELEGNIRDLEYRHDKLYRDVQNLEAKATWLLNFCDKHDIPVDDIPF